MIERKVFAWEPWFFMAFGLFHLHRIVTKKNIKIDSIRVYKEWLPVAEYGVNGVYIKDYKKKI